MSGGRGDLGSCDVCGPAPSEVLLRGEDRRHGTPGTWTVVRCRSCGLGRTRPVPDDLGAAYPEEGYMNHGERADAMSRLFALMMRRTAGGGAPGLAQLGRVAIPATDLGGPLAPGSRLLDVGCGSGHAVAALRAGGIDAHGIEPNPGAVAAAQRNGLATVSQGTLGDVSLAPESWDVIRFWHTLEHTPSPSRALAAAHAGLRPGGRVVIGVPNLDSVVRRAFGGDWDGLELPRHLHHFTRRSLVVALQAVGFERVRVRSVAVMGVLAGSLDSRTRRDPHQRTGGAWGLARPALHPLELVAAAAGRGDGLVATGVRL